MDLSISPNSLLKELIANKEFVHIVSTDVLAVTDNCLDFIWDVGISGPRGSESKIFNSNKHLVGLIRRGLSFGIKLSLEKAKKSKKWFEYDPNKIKVWILKRGMEKFGDLLFDFEKRLDQITPILGENLKGLKIVALEKLDGENSQISYFDTTDQWVIGSKNVTILCRDINDLESTLYAESRYESVKVSAYSWFRTLEQFKACSKGDFVAKINDLKKLLMNNTLLCETIGNSNRQHIINYLDITTPQLYFTGLVSKENKRDSCYNPVSLMQFLDPFFFKYTAKFVDLPSQSIVSESLEKRIFGNISISFSPICSFNNQSFDFQSIDELCNYLSVIQSIILTLRTNTEGIVLYLINSGQKLDQDIVLSAFKIKSLQFSTLRLIRENLKNSIIKNFAINGLDEYKEAMTQPYKNHNSIMKYSIDNFWFSVYKYLIISVQNNAENFFNVIDKNFKIIRKQISNVYNIFDIEIVNQIENEFVFFKQLLLYSSIYLIDQIIYLNLNNTKTDSVQLSRYFFDSFSSFISDIKSQISCSRKLTGIPPSICSTCNVNSSGSVIVSPSHFGSIPSGSTIEFMVPPFNWSWKEIKDMLSSDFSLSHDTWILNKDEYYVTLDQKDSSESFLFPFSKTKYHLFVNLRHVFDDCVSRERNQLYSYYKIFVPNKHKLSTDSNNEVIFTRTENSIKLSTFRSSSVRLFWKMIGKLDSATKTTIINEIGTKGYNQLNQNQQLVRKLETLPLKFPWVNKSCTYIFPSGYAINIRDFEHLLYAIFGSSDFKYVVNSFYNCETNQDLSETVNIKESPTGNGLKLETTFVLPCGIPGSGKSFMLKSFIKKQMSIRKDSYYVSALTSGEHVTKFDMEDESIYSLIVSSNNKSNSSKDKRFDLIFYVSKDGCTRSILNGFKWNYNALFSEKIPKTYTNYSLPADSSEDSLSETEFRKLSKKSKFCMNFIIESFINLCSEIVKGNYEKGSTKDESFPEWVKHLKSEYNFTRNLRILILVDMNHTPDAFVGINEDFSSKFKLTEITLYKVIVLFISQGFIKSSRRPKKWRFIMSKEEVIISILKMIKRKNHSTLKGLSRKSVNVLLHFLTLYSQVIKLVNENGQAINSVLSKNTFKSLGFNGVIEIKNDYTEFKSILKENSEIFASLKSDLTQILNNNIDLQNTKNSEKIVSRFMDNLEILSNSINSIPDSLNHFAVNSFYSFIYSTCNNIPFKESENNSTKLYYSLGNNLIIKPFNLNVNPKGDLGDYLSRIRGEHNLTAITFENHKSSIEAITKIWNDHKESLEDTINHDSDSKEDVDHKVIKLEDIPNDKKHVTCCFFGHTTDSNTKDKSNVEFLLISKTISNLQVLLSLPFIGRSYDFQVSYLIFIHGWKLAFLTVSPMSKLFEIPSNETNYDIIINEKLPNNSVENESVKEFSSNPEIDEFEGIGNKTSLLLTSLLPFRENGHSHITLISEKFNPVISNVAINLLGEDFSKLSSLDANEYGVQTLEVQVNEQPLEGILKKGLSEDDSKLDPVKTLRILAIRLWDKRIMLKGDLGYM
ncbi:hypothetical protein [Cryptosporidium parvum Iowa II]|uniref:Uncharacterized protein n=2 Tax=Cryptosporidium parvum TaxID=5807 RepID=Q5CUC2_CRYPI|nr:hypothetical protein [Cryptosporidium parvum Iowa II]EAK89000.1 hypothetical protein cgd3_3410 [Cryptosporidium parvum Iowa II]QOY42694.1 Uncharacterized protein CPATCC_0034430 [Cryptosporidium parvum]WKS77090.1 hypothetical protein CPCDC_3g3410 [Cryptosporidium sp. 43IA8]WRK31582.1 Uncharacterized protein cpbgf_3003410 [Cryptosporidium parvum]|eukprot:QOY42694.1 hypothetical protein CPATCC_001365 [Cryptosporidium parvum]